MSSSPGKWTFELVDSDSMDTIRTLDHADAKQLTLQFCRRGSFSFVLPIDDTAAYALKARATAVVATRNRTPIWSGPVISITEEIPADTVSAQCEGWLEELEHRFIRPEDEASLIFNGVVGGNIAMTLLDIANSQTTATDPTVVVPTHLTSGPYGDSQTRTLRYERGRSFWDAIRELSDIENGYDLFVNPISRIMSTRAPESFVDRPGALFAYGTLADNLEGVVRNTDGARIANRMNVVGSNGKIVAVDDSDAIADAKAMLEEWNSISASDPNIVAAFANEELVYKRYGVTTHSIKPQSYGNVPRLFDDFELGDKVYFTANRGRMIIPRQAIRVFSATIGFDTAGNEIISELGTAPSTG
jgi:hypothetical protein